MRPGFVLCEAGGAVCLAGYWLTLLRCPQPTAKTSANADAARVQALRVRRNASELAINCAEPEEVGAVAGSDGQGGQRICA